MIGKRFKILFTYVHFINSEGVRRHFYCDIKNTCGVTLTLVAMVAGSLGTERRVERNSFLTSLSLPPSGLSLKTERFHFVDFMFL